MARKFLFPVRVSWSLRRAPRALGEGQREHRQKMRRMKNPPADLLSAAGLQNSCDDELMKVICPTCQASPTTRLESRRISGEASASASESGSATRSGKSSARFCAAGGEPAPYFKTPPELCGPGNGLPNSSVVGLKESKNLRTGLALAGGTFWFPELLPGAKVGVSLPGNG